MKTTSLSKSPKSKKYKNQINSQFSSISFIYIRLKQSIVATNIFFLFKTDLRQKNTRNISELHVQ